MIQHLIMDYTGPINHCEPMPDGAFCSFGGKLKVPKTAFVTAAGAQVHDRAELFKWLKVATRQNNLRVCCYVEVDEATNEAESAHFYCVPVCVVPFIESSGLQLAGLIANAVARDRRERAKNDAELGAVAR